MHSLMRIFAASVAIFMLASCAHKQQIVRQPDTLEEAVQRQAQEPELALVFATLEAPLVDDALHPVLESLLYGNSRTGEVAIGFAGSPYDIRSEKLRQLHDASQKLKTAKDEGARTIGLGGFKLLESRNWAAVPPARYALYKYLGRDRKVADMQGWGRRDGKAYMVFDVNPGEAVYLGHIRAEILENGLLTVVVEDRFEAFRASLPPELQARVQKRLLRAPSTLKPESVDKLNNFTAF